LLLIYYWSLGGYITLKIKILGISGSPRHGNSEFLLNQAIDEIKKLKTIETETEIYSFVGKSFSPCRHCLACVKTGECIIEDDMQELKKKMARSRCHNILCTCLPYVNAISA
jgi:multimeric flavodoxin WrbA